MRRPGDRDPGFPQRLQTLVNAAGSIRDLATETGVAPKTIGDWLRGVRTPHASTLVRFAKDANTTVEWLLEGTPFGTNRSPDFNLIGLEASDGRDSLMGISSIWAEFWLGIHDTDDLTVVHADIALSPDIVAEEPVIIKTIRAVASYKVAPNEIVLVKLPDDSMRVRRAGPKGEHEGELVGTAVWTGHRVNRYISRQK